MSTLLKRTQLARQILQIQHELRSMPRSRLPHPQAHLRRQLTARRTFLIQQLHALTSTRITQTLLHRLAALPSAHKTLNI
jgi:hypothetical protein